MNVLIGPRSCGSTPRPEPAMAIYPSDPKPATVSVDDITQVACPVLSQVARDLVEPMAYHIPVDDGQRDGTTRVADDEHVVTGPIPAART